MLAFPWAVFLLIYMTYRHRIYDGQQQFNCHELLDDGSNTA